MQNKSPRRNNSTVNARVNESFGLEWEIMRLLNSLFAAFEQNIKSTCTFGLWPTFSNCWAISPFIVDRYFSTPLSISCMPDDVNFAIFSVFLNLFKNNNDKKLRRN